MTIRRHRLQGLFFAFLLALPGAATFAADWIYTVVDGDNLWDLSERYLDSPLRFEQIRRLNDVQFPRRMQPGTRLRVPMEWIRSNPASAHITAIQGSAELIRADGSTLADPAPGTPVALGDVLSAGPDSSIAVEFADGSVLTLHSASEMRFDHLSAHGETGMVDTRVRLLDGRLDTRVRPAVGPGSRFEIQTPSAISAVRGTQYRAAVVDAGEASNIEVLEGKVQVSGERKRRLIPAGFGTRVAVGQPPAPPRPLLPAPALDPLPAPVRALNWPVTWQAVPQAKAYRVEIAADRDLDVLLWDRVVERARSPLPDLPDGDYRLRVRAIDDQGLEGRSTVESLRIDARPQPPVALQPADGQVLRGSAAELRWTDSADADHYRLEIARDAAFSDIVLTREDLKATAFDTAEISEPGTYHWRLTSVAADGEHGPAGDARAWELKPVPEAVDAALDASGEDLVASWRPGEAGQSYQVQVAADAAFTDLELDRVIAEPRIDLGPVSGQVRFLRVRAIEPDGYLGPWGAVQRIDPPPDPTRWLIPALGVLGILLL
jgi:hypothetical protein